MPNGSASTRALASFWYATTRSRPKVMSTSIANYLLRETLHPQICLDKATLRDKSLHECGNPGTRKATVIVVNAPCKAGGGDHKTPSRPLQDRRPAESRGLLVSMSIFAVEAPDRKDDATARGTPGQRGLHAETLPDMADLTTAPREKLGHALLRNSELYDIGFSMAGARTARLRRRTTQKWGISQVPTEEDFFICIRRNPLKSPNSAKEKQGNPS